MSVKSDRRARKKQRRQGLPTGPVVLIRCDQCDLSQPLNHGHGAHPAGCTRCCHLYGAYTEAP